MRAKQHETVERQFVGRLLSVSMRLPPACFFYPNRVCRHALGWFREVALIGTEHAVAMGDRDGVLSSRAVVLAISGQATISVGQGAECRFEAPAERTRRESFDRGIACRHVNVQAVPLASGRHPGAPINRIDFDPLQCPAVFGCPIQKEFCAFGVMDIGSRDQDRENETERASQNRPLNAFDLFVPVEAAVSLLRSGDDAVRSQDPGGGLGGPTLLLTHRPRHQSRDVGPDPISPEPIVPPPHRLPGATLLGHTPWEESAKGSLSFPARNRR